jgi:hypothetical protein
MLGSSNKYALEKWLITAVIFFFCELFAVSQTPDLNRKLSLNYSNTDLEHILNELSQKAEIRFSYSPDLISVQQKITYSCHNKSIKEILEDIFKLSEIQYSIVNGYVVLKSNKQDNSEIPAKSATYTIKGVIVDSSSHEIMIGAALYIKESGIGVFSNNYGFYSLTLPKGIYTLQTSYMGYSSLSRTINLHEDITWDIGIRQVPFTMKEIVINSVNKEEFVFNSLAAQTNVDPGVVQRRSAALGETDMLKSLDNLPGICFQSDGSSYFSIRGGARDQNLILLDDAPIFNPSHLLGLFTPIIPEAIKHTEIYRADFPIQYGGRLSSVIDIRARDGNLMKFSGSSSISPVSSRFSVEGPFKKNASSYFVSFRVSTFGLLVKAANPNVETFYFADFNSKFNFRLGKRDRIYLTLFTGKDAFISKPDAVRNGLEWGNSSATLRWSHIYGNRLFSNTTLYASKYDYSLYTDYDKKIFWNSDITGANLKSEFSWYMTPRNNLRFGFNVSGYFFNPGNFNSPYTNLDTMRVSEVNSGEVVLYAGDDLELTKWLKVNVGLRFSNWSDYGEALSVVYNEFHKPVSYNQYEKGVRYYSKSFVEPRLSLSLKAGRYTSLKASYNRMIQHINQINNSISPFNSLEVWLPSGPNIKPQQADIYNIGIFTAWPDIDIDLSADVYYKKMDNQLGYAYHAEMLLNPYLEGELRQGNGKAYGFEILIRKNSGKLTGQIGYAFTKSLLQIKGLNLNRWYPSHQDKPMDISLLVDYKIRPRWSVNVNLMVTSGMPVTSPTGFYYYRGTQVPFYSEQNNDRFPDYKRADIGSVWRLNKMGKPFEHYLTFTVYNFFNTRNYAFLNFNKIQGKDDKFYVPADRSGQQSVIPTYRYIYSVIPSLTYSLKF